MKYYIEVLKKYAVFSGRTGRKEFWMFTLFTSLIIFALIIVDGLLDTKGLLDYGGLLVTIYAFVVFLPSLGVIVRRLHDTNRSGWWFLVSAIPVVGSIVLLIYLVMKSYPGDNAYGPSTKSVQKNS